MLPQKHMKIDFMIAHKAQIRAYSQVSKLKSNELLLEELDIIGKFALLLV